MSTLTRSGLRLFDSGTKLVFSAVLVAVAINADAASAYTSQVVIAGPPSAGLPQRPPEQLRFVAHEGAPSQAAFDGVNRDSFASASAGILRLSAFAQKEWSIEASAYVTDEFVVSSPIHESVRINFSVEMRGVINRDSKRYADAFAWAIAGPVFGRPAMVEVGTSDQDDLLMGVSLTNTQFYEVAVGTPFDVDFFAGLRAISHRPSTRVNADFLSTAHMYVWSDDPTVTITTASGFDYSPPAAIPEPSSFVLMLLGLGALWGFRVRNAH